MRRLWLANLYGVPETDLSRSSFHTQKLTTFPVKLKIYQVEKLVPIETHGFFSHWALPSRQFDLQTVAKAPLFTNPQSFRYLKTKFSEGSAAQPISWPEVQSSPDPVAKPSPPEAGNFMPNKLSQKMIKNGGVIINGTQNVHLQKYYQKKIPRYFLWVKITPSFSGHASK